MLGLERTQKIYTLRNFLRENRISSDLSLRITRHIAMTIKTQQRFTAMQDVQLLNLLSTTLKFTLQKELFSPFLSQHTFFNEVIALSSEAVQEFFDTVLQRQTF